MPYTIELMSLGGNYYSMLKSAADQLNGLQEEFEYRLTSENNRAVGLEFRQANYLSTDIWRFLKSHRTEHGGNRPYIIAFIDGYLESPSLLNLFGSHQASSGLAVVTIKDSAQYVKEIKRYCCYYLIRYTLSFINPAIKSHTDPQRSKCYFEQKKNDKRLIRASMDSGHICDICLQQLNDPTADGLSKRVSADELVALRKMREFVAGDYPYAIVMKGGGVKGLALASALVELEKYFWFDRHVGTSAGAIAAILLAADYSPTALLDILRKKNFADFMDAGWWRIPFNVLFQRGLFSGEHFQNWIAELIRQKKGKVAEIKMNDLNGALLYASRWGSGTVTFDSKEGGEHCHAVASFATRCSMSIPLFFTPQMVDGRRVFDGGMRNNFPLKKFLEKHKGSPFVALYLGKSDNRNRRWFLSELLDIWIDGEEREVVDEHRENVIVIDPSPIGTVDFRMSVAEKQHLVNVGSAAALRFLRNKNFEDGPDEETVQHAERAAEASRVQARWLRNKRRLIRAILLAIVVLVILILRDGHLRTMLWDLRVFKLQ